MTPDQFRAALAALGLTQAEAARRWRVNPSTIRRWCYRDPVPHRAVLMVEMEQLKRWPEQKQEETS